MSPALELLDICKTFGSTQAVRHVSLIVERGSVHAVLGENGAGKTTLLNVAYGLVRPDSGTVQRAGRPLQLRTPADAIAAGIGMVQQHFSVVPAMTVAENVALGGKGRYRFTHTEQHVRALSTQLGVALDPSAIVRDLPVSAQQRLEILKAVAHGVEVLILDEPTAVLSPVEATELMRWIRSYADQGYAVVLITHKLREALAVADAITVLRHGSVTLSAPATNIQEHDVLDAMLGPGKAITGEKADQRVRTHTRAAAGSSATTPSAVFVLRGVNAHDHGRRVHLHNASFQINAGQLVGVAAVEGSGHDLMLRLLAGRVTPTSGEIVRPRDVAFVPADRHAEAVALHMTLTENRLLRGISRRRGAINWSAEQMVTTDLLSEFSVHAASADAAMVSLSGGNQQRFVLARELSPLPAAVVVENPTRGLDVAAARTVASRLRDACQQGAAVVWYSSDVDELLSVADRILVIHQGSVVEASNPLSRDAIGRAMLGAQLS